ncbi:NADPH2:quinone reductase [Herbihabitans rhizosphaerae]|uniref:NADPH2:quinone reductase n=1 Tax=Herbihabitans rhizosphaerae TaxID=1872711 RepID=A0A4Q7KH88_9PSEU|nr:zinc-binding dehydrogenase [Herbihabitans rhizosphaerae]RZS33894.1 NADPH2:quinone reductase [Herbihabitans rhizosphaerae]
MHAIRQHAFGPAENLVFEEVADPHAGPGQVRIAVSAAGVHLLDTSIRSGNLGGPFPLPELPMTPGREVAGVVDEIGDGVDKSWLGKRVVAHLGQASGGYAELAVREVENVHELPDEVADDVAVAMIGTGRTTLAVLELAELTENDVALVTAAAGGIGNLLVQEGRNVGATVIGVAGGPSKVDRVRALRADVAVDYTQTDWPDQVRTALDGRTVTVVFDSVGGTAGRAALDLLGPGGRLIMFGYSSGEPTPFTQDDVWAKGMTASVAVGARIMNRPGGLRGLEIDALAAVASGRFTPVSASTFPLAEAAAAHTALESRATVGKVVLKP